MPILTDFTVSDNTVLDNTVSNVTVSGGVIILTVETSMMSGDEPIVSYEYDTMTDGTITDAGGNKLAAFTDREVTDILSTLPLTVSVAGSVLDGSITTSDTVSYTVTFNKVVTDFIVTDITLSGTASGGTPVPSNFAGSGAVYTFDVTATSDGTLAVSILADVATAMATDAQNRDNSASNTHNVTFNIVVRIATFVDTIGSSSHISGSNNGEFNIPYGIATNSTHILVTDLRNERVQIFDLDGDHISTFGGFTQIRGVTATSTQILVVDGGNNRVQIFDLDGTLLSSFGGGGSGDGRFNIPGGITTNSTHILVVDASNNRVQVFDLEYNYVGQFGGSSPNSGSNNGQFNTPREITTNSTHILVADRNNHRIQVFDLDGNYVSQIGGSGSGSGDGQFSKPSGVAVTPTHILVADDLNHRVQVFDLDGNYVSQFGGMGAGDHQFNRPIGITTNSTHMLVTDSRNHRVQIFDLAPTVAITADTPDGLIHNSDTVSYTAVFAGAVTGFDITDIDVSGTASGGFPAATNFAGIGDTYTFDVEAASDGTIMVSIPKLAARDTSGNPNLASTAYSVTVADDAPVVTAVSAEDGPYYEDDTVDITVRFNEAVDVTGPPQLLLETGINDAVADYSSGTGTPDIVFSYTVAAAHDSADLNYVGTGSLSLNGGSIVAINGGASASLTLPATDSGNSLADSSDVMVNPPTVIITSNIPDGGITDSTTISYTATFSEDVTDFVDAVNPIIVDGTAGGTASDLSGTENIYTFTVTASQMGTVIVSIPADAATDTAGNGNAASDIYTVTLGTAVPVATFTDTIGSMGPEDGKFNSPYGITTNSTHILVADTLNNRIQVFDSVGNYVSKFDDFGTGNGQFNNPQGITTNSTHILVADTGNHRIQIFDLDGNYVSQFGSDGKGNGHFNNPQGITTNSTHILVADTGNFRIQIFDLDGNYVSKFGSDGRDNGQFRFPTGITTNSTHILVADSGNSRVQIFDLVGSFVGKFGSDGTDNGQFSSTSGIAVTPIRILVTDLNSGRVQIFDLDGSFVGKFGSQGQGDGQFLGPRGITTNSTHILVADSGNDRIQVFDFAPTVVITTINSIGGIHNSGTVSYIVTFSEDVTGFDVDDIVISGTAFVGPPPAATNFAGSGNTYTFDVETTGAGTVTVVIPRLAVTDGVGGKNMASDTHTVTVDTTLFGIVSAVWSDSDEPNSILSDGDELTLMFNQDTDMAGSPPLSRSELDAIFDFGGSLGANYTGAWSGARTLVITVIDSTDADAAIGDTISPFRGTTFIRSIDTAGGTALFDNPVSVGTNSTGHVFVGDDVGDNVQIFHPDGVYAGEFDPRPPEARMPDTPEYVSAAFFRPAGIATNSTGYTFIADNGLNLVQIFDPSGVYAGALDTTTDGLTFRDPAGVAIGKDDMIYVSDTAESSQGDSDRRIVQIFDRDGTYKGLLTTRVSTEFNVPISVATNSSGHVFVADSGNDNIRIFDSDGRVNTSNIDTTGPTTGSALSAVATNSTDHLFVVYNNNNDVDTVQVYTASGVYAGDQSFGDDVNLVIISGIAVGSDDKIIVSERSNADLRSKDAVHIFGHQVLYSDTGVEQFEFPIPTSGDFGIPRVPVTIMTDVNSGDTTEETSLGYTVVFDRKVTDFALTDIVISGTAMATAPASTFFGDGIMYTFDVDVTTDGTVIISIPMNAAFDLIGIGNAASDVHTVTFVDIVPNVTGVSADDGPYKEGDTFDITVTFDEPVNVTGIPQLLLETGADDDDDAVVDYSSGTGTTELVFPYTVGATHNSDDLNYVNEDSLTLNVGVSIVATDDDAVADLRLPATTDAASLGGSDVIVDTEAPAFGSAATTDNITIEITVTEPLDETMTAGIFRVPTKTVTGTTEISDNTITITVSTAIVSGDAITVLYTAAAAGGVTDVAGNALATFGPETVTNNVPAVTGPTVIIATDDADNGGTAISDVLLYTVTFSETVTGFDDTSDITLSGTATANVSAPTGTGDTYAFVVTATSDGTVIVTIPADATSNGNMISNTYTVTVDSPVQFAGKFGSFGKTDGLFDIPVSLTTNSTHILVADTNNNRVQVFDLDGIHVSTIGNSGTTAGDGDGEFSNPSGIAVNSTNIMVTDLNNHRVQIFDLEGNYVNQFGISNPFEDPPRGNNFDSPVGITANATHILVVDSFHHRVQVFDTDGNFESEFGRAAIPQSSHRYHSIAMNSTHILVTETSNDWVDVFDSAGNYLRTFGSVGSANGQLNSPTGIIIHNNLIYIADFNNDRIQIFDSNAEYVGKFGSFGTGDGRFNSPSGLATNSTHILVADHLNSRIQTFILDSDITGVYADDGAYKAGDTVDIRVTFDEAVNVEFTHGTPTLTLDTGAMVEYTSGTGETELLFQYTVDAEENSADLNYADINSLALNGGTITATTHDDTLILRLPAVTSANSLAGSSAVIVDTAAPTVIIDAPSTPHDGAQNTDTVSYTVTFNETVTEFIEGDITVTGTASGGFPEASNFAGTGADYTFDVVTNGDDGTVMVTIPADVAEDGAENGNEASATYAVTVDTIAPILESVIAVDLANVEITFDESITGSPTPSEFPVSDGIRTRALSIDGTKITLQLGDMLSNDSHTVSYPVSGSVTDMAGNPVAVFGSQLIKTPTLENVPPNPVITSDTVDHGKTTIFNRIIYSVDFGETVSGFDKSDILLDGQASADADVFVFPLEDFNTPSRTFTVTVTTGGMLSVSIPENRVIDTSSNSNTESNTYTVTIDTTPPEYSSSVTTDAITITITADRPLMGPADKADFTVSDHMASDNTEPVNTVSDVTVSGGVIILTVEPPITLDDTPGVSYTDGTITDDIITDAGGNALAAFVPQPVLNTLRTDPLTVTITGDDTPDGGTTIRDTVSYTVTFNKVVNNFDAADITVSGTASGTASDDTLEVSSVAPESGGIRYTFDVEATSDGTITVSVPENMVTDAAGKGNTASAEYTVTLDITVPIGTFVHSIGDSSPDSGTGNGAFNNPYGVATTSTHIQVVDFNNERIQIFDSDGNYVSQFGGSSNVGGVRNSGNGEFNTPRGITTNSTHILVADTFNNRIQIFDLDGNYLNKFGRTGSGDGRFNFPSDITTNSTHILIPDTNSNRIQIFDSDGNYLNKFGSFGSGDGKFDKPSGIAINSTHILVADADNDRIQIFDSDGNYFGKFGSRGSGDGQFNTPRGITTTSTYILVADTHNHRVQVFDNNGDYLSSIGSSGANAGTGENEFNAPHGITTNSTHMLVTDFNNHRVQIFDLAPMVTITASTPNGLTHNSGTISYTAVFSEAVTGFVMTDIAVSGTASVGSPAVSDFAGSGTTYTFNVVTPSDDTVTVFIPKLVATDTAGNSNPQSAAYSVTVTDAAPVVSGVSAEGGPYNEGDTFDITVTFDKAVNVTGTLQLLLETGDNDAVVDYSYGAGTTELVFPYTVAATHNSADLNYVGTDSLLLDDGSIVAAADKQYPCQSDTSCHH